MTPTNLAENATRTETAGPTALVTGASRGIGAHLVRGLLEAGYRVVGLSRTGDAPEDLPGDAAFEARACDVTDADEVESAVAEALAALGRIDVLVNCAGVADAEVPLWEADPQEWWRTLEVNVRGPFLVSRAVVPHMIRAGGGRIVDLNSGSGVKDTDVATAYNASKSALFRVTSSIARAGAEHGVRAFSLAPGVVETDMTRAMRAHDGRTQWTAPEEVARLVIALVSGRLDAWSGRMVRAGADTVEELERLAAAGLTDRARTLGLLAWGEDDLIGA